MKTPTKLLALAAALALTVSTSWAADIDLAKYEFGTTAAGSISVTTEAQFLTLGDISSATGSGTANNGSPVAPTGTSRGYFFTASSWTNANNNYFEFTLTVDADYEVSLSSLSVYYRATTTGPTSYTIDINSGSTTATGSLTNDASWYSLSEDFTNVKLTGTNTVRIYASGASSTAGTLRIDDLLLKGSVSQIPEPSTYAAILAALGFLAIALRRRKS